MREGGVEPPWDCSRWILSVICCLLATPLEQVTYNINLLLHHKLLQFSVWRRLAGVLYRIVQHGGTYEAPILIVPSGDDAEKSGIRNPTTHEPEAIAASVGYREAVLDRFRPQHGDSIFLNTTRVTSCCHLELPRQFWPSILEGCLLSSSSRPLTFP